jgi:hypothetical protein
MGVILDFLFGSPSERNMAAFTRQMRKATGSALADVPEGVLVRVTGRAVPLDGRVLDAPLSGRACLFFRANAHAVPPASNGFGAGLGSREIATEHAGVPFLIEDGATRAFIDTTYARLACIYDHATESMADFDANPEQRMFLLRHDVIRRNVWFNTHHVEYQEAIIEPGELVTVVGAAMYEPDPEGRLIDATDYRSGSSMRLVFSGSKKAPLMISDDPRAHNVP